MTDEFNLYDSLLVQQDEAKDTSFDFYGDMYADKYDYSLHEEKSGVEATKARHPVDDIESSFFEIDVGDNKSGVEAPQKQKQLAPPTSRAITVSDLEWWTTDVDLEEIFSAFGKITKLEILYDELNGKSKGYAYIEFEEISTAQTAFQKAKGKLINGRACVLHFATATHMKQLQYSLAMETLEERNKFQREWMNRNLTTRAFFASIKDLQPLPQFHIPTSTNGSSANSIPPVPTSTATTSNYPSTGLKRSKAPSSNAGHVNRGGSFTLPITAPRAANIQHSVGTLPLPGSGQLRTRYQSSHSSSNKGTSATGPSHMESSSNATMPKSAGRGRMKNSKHSMKGSERQSKTASKIGSSRGERSGRGSGAQGSNTSTKSESGKGQGLHPLASVGRPGSGRGHSTLHHHVHGRPSMPSLRPPPPPNRRNHTGRGMHGRQHQQKVRPHTSGGGKGSRSGGGGEGNRGKGRKKIGNKGDIRGTGGDEQGDNRFDLLAPPPPFHRLLGPAPPRRIGMPVPLIMHPRIRENPGINALRGQGHLNPPFFSAAPPFRAVAPSNRVPIRPFIGERPPIRINNQFLPMPNGPLNMGIPPPGMMAPGMMAPGMIAPPPSTGQFNEFDVFRNNHGNRDERDRDKHHKNRDRDRRSEHQDKKRRTRRRERVSRHHRSRSRGSRSLSRSRDQGRQTREKDKVYTNSRSRARARSRSRNRERRRHRASSPTHSHERTKFKKKGAKSQSRSRSGSPEGSGVPEDGDGSNEQLDASGDGSEEERESPKGEDQQEESGVKSEESGSDDPGGSPDSQSQESGSRSRTKSTSPSRDKKVESNRRNRRQRSRSKENVRDRRRRKRR